MLIKFDQKRSDQVNKAANYKFAGYKTTQYWIKSTDRCKCSREKRERLDLHDLTFVVFFHRIKIFLKGKSIHVSLYTTPTSMPEREINTPERSRKSVGFISTF